MKFHSEEHYTPINFMGHSAPLGTDHIDAQAMDWEPSHEEIDNAAHILSEWLDDSAPMHERQYRAPARAVLKYAEYMRRKKNADH